MKSYSELFAELGGRTALIPFFVIGDPDFDTSLRLVKAAIDAGADVLELGVAFSDPVADGPTIQKADVRVLKAGLGVARALEFVRQLKDYRDIPVGLLMYYNLIVQYGLEKFFADAHAAGVNSVLVADVTVDDAAEIADPAKAAGLDTVFMATPNTSDERLRRIAEATTGFVYTVSLMGVTGARVQLSDTVGPLVKRLKAATTVPVCVGFGISSAEHAAAVARAGADGVIIGSRIVQIIEDNLTNPDAAAAEIGKFVREVRARL